MPVEKEQIEIGFRWGTFTYQGESDKSRPSQRVVIVKCDCGKEFHKQLAALRLTTLHSCGSDICRNNLKAKVQAEIEEKKEFAELERILKLEKEKNELENMTKWWSENVEKTGCLKNAAIGMSDTKEYLNKSIK